MKNNILNKYNQTNQFGKFLDLILIEANPGEVKYSVNVKKQHLATVKSAHGGFISAIFDQVVGTAALSQSMNQDKLVSTVEFKINYLKLLGFRHYSMEITRRTLGIVRLYRESCMKLNQK